MESIAGERLEGQGADAEGVHAEAQQSGYADVSRLPLRELIAADDTAFGHSMRRLLADMDRPQEIIAGFSSYAR